MVRVLCYVAGIDYDILRRCPNTDKMWAVQLGLWLIVPFIFIFIITFHSTSYVPELNAHMPMRATVAALVALSVFLFDRALFQKDWFCQGYFRPDHPTRSNVGTAERIFYVGSRFAASLAMAYVLSRFLELALFSGAITDHQLKQQREANAPLIAKVEQYRKSQEVSLATQHAAVEEQRKQAGSLVRTRDGQPAAADPRMQDLDKQLETTSARERQLTADIRAKQTEMSERKLEVICETQGTKPDRQNPDRCSGVPSCGPRCRTAIALVKVLETDVAKLTEDLASAQAETRRIVAAKDRVAAEFSSAVERQRAGTDQRARELAAEIDRMQAALTAYELSMPERIRAYEAEIRRSPGWVEIRTDPLLWVKALEDLKADKDYGVVVTTYALMLKIFVVFIELLPVIGKMFLSPPSAYAIHVQKRVASHQKVDLDPPADDPQTTEQATDASSWGGWRQKPADPGASGGMNTGGDTRKPRHLTIVPSPNVGEAS